MVITIGFQPGDSTVNQLVYLYRFLSNIDDRVNFAELQLLISFYRDVFTCYSKAFFKDKDTFVMV